MDSAKLGFTFAGGFKDGCVLRGDSSKSNERNRVDGFAAITDGGTIGKKIRGRSKESHEQVHEKLAEGEPVEEARTSTYEVVSHATEENGFLMVTCQFIGVDE